nr:SDR family oxidoreductase [Streptomonospora nanhaiensis]
MARFTPAGPRSRCRSRPAPPSAGAAARGLAETRHPDEQRRRHHPPAHRGLDGGGVRPRRTVPLHRLGTAAELAKAAVYLASDESAYTAGTVLRVDGGIGELAH